MNSARIGLEGYVKKNEILTLYSGHEIALHTHTHPTTAFIPSERVINEVIENRKELEKITGTVIRGMSYPNNSFNDSILLIIS